MGTRILISWSTFLFIALSCYSQTYITEWAEPMNRSKYMQFAGANDQAYFLWTNEKKAHSISKYDFQHKLIETKPVVFPKGSDGKMNSLVKPIRTSSGNYGFIEKYDKKAKVLKAYYCDLSETNFGQLKPLFEQEMSSYSRLQTAIRGLTPALISHDQSKIAFIYNLNPKKRTGSVANFLMIVLNDKMELQWKKMVTIEDKVKGDLWDKSKPFVFTDVTIDNDGKIYLLKNTFKLSKDGSSLGLYIVNEGEVSDHTCDFDKEKIPTIAGFIPSHDDESNFHIGGFYRKRGALKQVLGTYLMKNIMTDKSLELNEFTPSVREQLERGIIKKVHDDMWFFEKSFLFENGSSGFVVSSHYDQVRTKSNGSESTIHHSSSLYVAFFSKDGALKELILPRHYATGGSEYMGDVIVNASTPSDIQLLYNSKPRKKAREGKERTISYIATINSEGDISAQRKLFNEESGKEYFLPIYWCSSKEALLFASITAFASKIRIGLIHLQ